MRRFAVAVALSLALASAAVAADRPVIGPVPAWVKPVSRAPDTEKPDEAPIRILMIDQQASLEPGRQTLYSDTAIKIQTPQGLAIGNLSIPWRPETDVLTVHKLVVRRGDETIDVLGSGQTFTVLRREQNLDSAVLDGVLTANIQPEGLQVGDILEFATSMTSSDPVMGGHVEQLSGFWGQTSIGRLHLRVQWPSGSQVRLRQSGPLPVLKPATSGGMSAVELTLDDVQPVVPPKGAPARYAAGRMIEFSDFASWAELSALMAPLYQKAATVPAAGPLRVELERIRSQTKDPGKRAEAALALVQDRIRYVALAMGEGGLVPADAETTWSRRFGDCKGKTALLLALLDELGIEAEPVLVNALSGDGFDARLPMVGLFNHVLVRADIAGKTYWLDGTRSGDTSLGRLQTPALGWGLPVRANGAELVRMMPPPLAEPVEITSIRIDARAGLTVPAPIKAETLLRGDGAVFANTALAALAGEARTSSLREYWRDEFNFVEIKSADATFDAATGELRLTMEGLAKMDWDDGWYETDGMGIGYQADFTRDAGPDRDAPFAVAYPFYDQTTETILLPPGFSKVRGKVGEEVNETVAGIEYRRHATLADDVFTIEKTERSVAPEFPAKEAATAQARLRELAETAVYIRRPASYRPTDQEVAAAMETTPTTAAGFFERGRMLMERARWDEAIQAFDKAVALDPKDPWAPANRGIAYAWKGQTDAATKDFDTAAALDPRNAVVFRGRGLVAQRKGAHRDAIAAYTRALEIEPSNAFALLQRANVHAAVDETDAALADAAAALKLDPDLIDARALRLRLLFDRGGAGDATADAQSQLAAAPENASAHIAAGRAYFMAGDREAALKEYDRAIAIEPKAMWYAERSTVHPRQDH